MARKDLHLFIGETWTIAGTANNYLGVPIDLTTVNLQLRICSPIAVMIDINELTGITEDAIVAGDYLVNITPAQQENFDPNVGYDYEVRYLTNDGAISIQNWGRLILRESLWHKFPPTPPAP